MKMRQNRLIWTHFLRLIAIGALVPAGADAADSQTGPRVNTPPAKVLDVRLDGQGGLSGVLLTKSGQPVVGVPAALHGVRQERTTTITGRNGEFHFAGVAPGLYRLRVGADQVLNVRVWEPATAPPNTPERLLVILDSSVTRGQRRVSDLLTLDDKLVVGGMVAAAITIPIAIANSDKDVVPVSP